ncbi:MAG: hypothetical protein ABFS12_12285 [Bacteroidota bacterium]
MTNWEVFSAVFEIVGTTAVIITLIYVAVQVKLNSKQLASSIQSTKTQTWHSVNEDFNVFREMVLTSNNAEIWIKGINNFDDLNRNDRMRFNMMAATFIWTVWLFYQVSKNEGLMPDANSHLFSDLYKHEGFNGWLKEHEKLHTDDFGDFLKSVRENVGKERYKIGESSSLTNGIY